MTRTPKNLAAEVLAIAILRFLGDADNPESPGKDALSAEVAQALEAYLALYMASHRESEQV